MASTVQNGIACLRKGNRRRRRQRKRLLLKVPCIRSATDGSKNSENVKVVTNLKECNTNKIFHVG